MDTNVPIRPVRVSREDARTAKERAKLFNRFVKAKAKAEGWRYANRGLFRQHGDRFVSVLSHLLWGRGARVMLLAKPMAIDPLFWRIVGLSENEQLPLSFRANGAWVLRPPFLEASISLDVTDPEQLAEDVVAWSTMQLAEVEASSVDTLLSNVAQMGTRREHFAALEICLHLLQNEYDRALALCRDGSIIDSGGFMTGDQTFFDPARNWIAKARRSEIGPV